MDFERSLLECVLSAVKQPPDAGEWRSALGPGIPFDDSCACLLHVCIDDPP